MTTAMSMATKFMAARIASGPADRLVRPEGAAILRAAGVATGFVDGEPVVVVTFVENTTQFTLTLDADEADTFCHVLADAVRWQTAALAPATGSVN